MSIGNGARLRASTAVYSASEPLRDQSVNPYDPLCGACEGPLNTDARHRVTLSALYHAPFGINVSGIMRYRSATPYTILAGDISCGPDKPNCQDGYAFDLPAGVSHVNSERGASFSQTDVRVGKEFKFAGNYGVELIGEIFNLFNAKNESGFRSDGTPARFAGDPLQGEQRLMQLGVRFTF